MEVTIRDVAVKAQVSFQLVSAVLGNKSYARASAVTREKIEQAARELGYYPNISAQILQGGSSKLIGVMIDSRAPEEAFSLLAELEQAATAHGYRILIAEAHDDPEKLFSAYCALKQNRVDGVISLSHDYPGIDYHLEEKLKTEKKLVFVQNIREHLHSYVDVDMAEGFAMATRHLQKEGYRNIALLLSQRARDIQKCQTIQSRIHGFHSVLPGGNVFYVPGADPGTACRQLIDGEFKEKQIDAVVAQNDYIAAFLQKELLAAGKKLPEDFGLVGCDNRLVCQCMPLELSTITYDRKSVAEKTIEFILKLIVGEDARLAAVFQPQLIVRASSQRKKAISEKLNINQIKGVL